MADSFFKWDTGERKFLDEDAMTSNDAEAVASQQSIKAYVDAVPDFPLLDEDNMASNSDTSAASQQSIKSYVDTEIASAIDFSYLDLPDLTAPATPASGDGRLYVNGDRLYFKNDGGLVSLLSNHYFSRVYRTNIQSHTTSGQWQFMSFDAENYDPFGIHDNSVNPTRLTSIFSGYYLIGGMIEFYANTTGLRGIAIRKNGAGSLHGVVSTPAHTTLHGLSTSNFLYLAANDYVELGGYQTSGGALDMNYTANLSNFWMFLVSI